MARMVGAMGERLRSHHVLSWSAVGVAAAALVVACFVASLEIAIEAFIGAGNEQRGFTYERELALASFDVGWPGPLALVAGLALVAAAVTGIVVGSRPWLVVASFAVAVALALLVFDTEDQRLRWAGPGGVIGYESPHGGALLQPALDELQAEARASSEAPQPRLGAAWRRGRLLVARTHRLAGLPLVRAGARLVDRLQALPAGTPAVGVGLPRGRRHGGDLRLVGPPKPYPIRLTKACALRVSLRTLEQTRVLRPTTPPSPNTLAPPPERLVVKRQAAHGASTVGSTSGSE